MIRNILSILYDRIYLLFEYFNMYFVAVERYIIPLLFIVSLTINTLSNQLIKVVTIKQFLDKY